MPRTPFRLYLSKCGGRPRCGSTDIGNGDEVRLYRQGHGDKETSNNDATQRSYSRDPKYADRCTEATRNLHRKRRLD